MHKHEPVAASQPFRRTSNRYRLECGYYIDCGYIHEVGTLAYCLHHGRDEQVIWSAIVTSQKRPLTLHSLSDLRAIKIAFTVHGSRLGTCWEMAS